MTPIIFCWSDSFVLCVDQKMLMMRMSHRCWSSRRVDLLAYSGATMTRLGSSVARRPLPPSPRIRTTAAAVPPPLAAAKNEASVLSAASSSTKPPLAQAAAPTAASAATSLYQRTKDRGPVSWTSLFLVTVAASTAVGYYSIEREKRLERAMGQVVSSEFLGDDNTNKESGGGGGWSPRPDYLAKRKFVPTKYGWFPVDDGFGAREWGGDAGGKCWVLRLAGS
jgi:hypothetical protein